MAKGICIKREGKTGTVVYCNFTPEKHAAELIISSSCQTNLFYFTLMATFSLDSTKTDASIIYFLAFNSIPHNDQSCAYKSEQEAFVCNLGFYFLLQIRIYVSDNLYNS